MLTNVLALWELVHLFYNFMPIASKLSLEPTGKQEVETFSFYLYCVLAFSVIDCIQPHWAHEFDNLPPV